MNSNGFPINFNGEEHGVAPEKIQLTRALILAAVYIARIKELANDIIELDEDLQDRLVKKFEQLTC